MAYTLPNFTTTQGPEELLVYGASQQAEFMPLILLFIYLAIALVGFFIQDRRTGAGNLPMWFSVSGLITTTGAFILFMFDNLIRIEVLIILVLVTIASAFWFLASERD